MGMLKPSSQKHMNGSQKMLNAPVQLGKQASRISVSDPHYWFHCGSGSSLLGQCGTETEHRTQEEEQGLCNKKRNRNRNKNKNRNKDCVTRTRVV